MNFKDSSNRTIIMLFIFGSTLILMRFIFTGVSAYFFLWYNLFLGSISLIISHYILKHDSWVNNHFKFISLSVLWLLFLPNAPYITTDLLHVSDSQHRFVWFDILMIFSFAVCGMYFGLVSVKQMADIILQKTNPFLQHLFISLSLFASAFGVYLGRYHRYNSWDLIHHPNVLIQDITERFMNPFDHPRTWGMTLLMGVFLHIFYFGLRPKT
ncbi:MAG: DUF1361 domain-containing protein [Bacteroidetes bacterium]|nr:DUF1361 domain-containing protein [Bacteroidota bacterium]